MRSLLLLLLSFNVFADDIAIGNNFLYSFDTEGNQIIQDTVSGWFHTQQKDDKMLSQDFGVGYTYSWYLNKAEEQEYHYNGSAISLLSNFKYKDFSMVGSAGIAQLNVWNSHYFVGDMNFNYQYNKNSVFSFGVYGDVVDSTNAMQEEIVFTGYALSFDYYNDYGGIAGNVGQMFYSDNNVRNNGNLKIYADIMDGLNAYLKTKQYSNSNANNGMYWSPELYSRYGLGIGFRQRYAELIFSGFLEGGVSHANEEWLPATAWRLNIENVKRTSNWIANVAIGSDISGDDNYKWFYINANLRYNF